MYRKDGEELNRNHFDPSMSMPDSFMRPSEYVDGRTLTPTSENPHSPKYRALQFATQLDQDANVFSTIIREVNGKYVVFAKTGSLEEPKILEYLID